MPLAYVKSSFRLTLSSLLLCLRSFFIFVPNFKLLKINVVNQSKKALFLAFKELLFFLLLDLLLSHVTSTLVLRIKVLIYKLHLLRRRVELEGDDPGGPLCRSPINELDCTFDNNIPNAREVCILAPPGRLADRVKDTSNGYTYD